MPSADTPVLLIDLSSLAHPIWHASQQEPDPDYTSQRTAAIVRQLAAEHPHAAICCDSPQSFRKELDETYKANRPAADAALLHQIDLTAEALAADGFPVWQADGFEGDDLIATATHQLTADSHDVVIVTADKDLLSLVGPHVEIHSTRTGSRLGPVEVQQKLGVEPCQVVDYLTLAGDASDNIVGAKGIGPKTATWLLGVFGSLDGVYRAIDSGDAEGLKPSTRASLEELRTRLEAVRALITMRTDVPLDVTEVFQPRAPAAAKDFQEDEQVEKQTEAAEPQDDLGQAPAAEPAPTQADPPAEPAALTVEPAPAEWHRGLEPRSMVDARQLSKWMFDSRMFGDYGTPQAVLSTMLLGRELGMPAMAALRSVHIIEGKHSLSADLMVALVLKSGLAEYFQLIESTEEICTFETHRKGNPEPTRLSYTIEQARQAGLLVVRQGRQPGNWQKIPKQMLRARCKSELARLEYPDLLAGLYTPDELRDARNGS